MSTTAPALLAIDARAESDRIAHWLRAGARRLGRRGFVLGISGGVDSAVCLALCIRAVGPDRVVPLVLPERDSDPASQQLATALAARFGVSPVIEDLTAALTGLGCYRRRDEAISRAFPPYDPSAGHRARITLPANLLGAGTMSVYSLGVVAPGGAEHTVRLAPEELAQIVASTNLKQRTRAAMLYHHAELRRFAVAGAINRSEQDLGFFVKHADDGVDLKPIGHLYKTQVYQLARHLEVPDEIIDRTPTSDTYSAPVSQEEFFFRVPFDILDPLLAARQGKLSESRIGASLHLAPEQVQHVRYDIDRKSLAARYLQTAALQLPAPEPASDVRAL